MMVRHPIRTLKTLFPWPDEKPQVPEQHGWWFSLKKQILLREVVPRDAKLVVELGSWLGDSTRWFCEYCPKATIVAVDTWLGSAEHLLRRRGVLPILYDTFLVNCWKHREQLIPFRNTSLAALNFLGELGLKPDVIYFECDHSYWGLTAELETANSLFPSAMFIGDDYTGGRISEALADFLDRVRSNENNNFFSKVDTLHNTWHLQRV